MEHVQYFRLNQEQVRVHKMQGFGDRIILEGIDYSLRNPMLLIGTQILILS